MSVIRWLVVQEVCLRLNLPAILNLIWSGHPPFICAFKHDDFRRTLLCYVYEYITYNGMFIGNRCSHAHMKGGWPGQMRFKMAGKFKTTTNFLHYKPAYNGHYALAKRVYTGRNG